MVKSTALSGMNASCNRSGETLFPDPVFLDVSGATLTVTPEQFDRLCLNNPDLRLELTADRKLIVMAPVGGAGSSWNFDLTVEVGIWNRQSGLGRAFDSSCGYDFTLIGGGKMSPDVSWIERSRLEGINIVGYITIVPDFVIELRSATDNLKSLQEKMQEYQRLGVKLGLLINPQQRQVEIYRAQSSIVLQTPNAIDCGDVMPGFVLTISRIWPLP
jgi:Uma2 family endonuclease